MTTESYVEPQTTKHELPQYRVCSAGEACMCRKKCPLQREAADELERLQRQFDSLVARDTDNLKRLIDVRAKYERLQRDLRGVEACYGQVNAANDRLRAALVAIANLCSAAERTRQDHTRDGAGGT